jgi:hypothetical protein
LVRKRIVQGRNGFPARGKRFCDDILDAKFPPRLGIGSLVGLARGNSVNRRLVMAADADRYLLFGLLGATEDDDNDLTTS